MRARIKLHQSYLFFLFVALFFSLGSCRQNTKPDVSDIQLSVKIHRFDQDLFAAKAKPIPETDTFLKHKYGKFYQDYVQRILGNETYNGIQILQTLYKDQAYTDLNTETQHVFPNLSDAESELTQTFKYIKYYYPKAKVPQLISFISGFAVQTPVGDDYVGIGLDMFLGKNSKFYPAIVQSVPAYLSRRFSPEYLVSRVTETYTREELFPESDEDRTFLSKMIHHGKILYFMDQVLPAQLPDSIKIGYTNHQMEWCKNFETDIWAYYLENNLLFETDYQKFQVFLTEGPFTPGLGERNESAPKLGVWTGWQIVKRYMQEHKDISLQQLMRENDAQKILRESRYKPKN